MKPENAIVADTATDLSACAFEEALVKLKYYPVCTLTIHPDQVAWAQRMIGAGIPTDLAVAVTSPIVNVKLDESYKPYEWSVEYGGKVYWSPGA